MNFFTIIFTILIFLGFLLLFSSLWAFSYFGLSCFEQIIYHLKVPLEGTNTEFIYDWFKLCFVKALIITFLCFIPILFIDIYNTYYGFITLSIFALCLLMAAYKSGLLGFIKNLFSKSDLYEKYYVNANQVKLTFPNKKRNLIHIYVESLENTYSSKENGGDYPFDLIPELSKLAFENTHFTHREKLGGAHVVAGTGWTTGALVAQSAGVPLFTPLHFRRFKEDNCFLPGVQSLGDILAEQGYNQEYLIGSDAMFGGRKFYYDQHGPYEIFDLNSAYQKNKIPKGQKEFWGYDDQTLFTFAKEELLRLASKSQPFNLSLLTVDTHHPKGYESSLCKHDYPERLSNIIRCNSAQIGSFVEWIKEQSFYENTTIIISGDHLSMAAKYIHETYDKNYDRTIFNAFINTSTIKQRKTQSFTSFDMFPTTLAALGVDIEGEHLGLGVNLFSQEKTLVETIGKTKLDKELRKQSEYYRNKILKKSHS